MSYIHLLGLSHSSGEKFSKLWDSDYREVWSSHFEPLQVRVILTVNTPFLPWPERTNPAPTWLRNRFDEILKGFSYIPKNPSPLKGRFYQHGLLDNENIVKLEITVKQYVKSLQENTDNIFNKVFLEMENRISDGRDELIEFQEQLKERDSLEYHINFTRDYRQQLGMPYTDESQLLKSAKKSLHEFRTGNHTLSKKWYLDAIAHSKNLNRIHEAKERASIKINLYNHCFTKLYAAKIFSLAISSFKEDVGGRFFYKLDPPLYKDKKEAIDAFKRELEAFSL